MLYGTSTSLSNLVFKKQNWKLRGEKYHITYMLIFTSLIINSIRHFKIKSLCMWCMCVCMYCPLFSFICSFTDILVLLNCKTSAYSKVPVLFNHIYYKCFLILLFAFYILSGYVLTGEFFRFDSHLINHFLWAFPMSFLLGPSFGITTSEKHSQTSALVDLFLRHYSLLVWNALVSWFPFKSMNLPSC